MKVLLHICCSNCAVYPVKIFKEERHDFAGFWFNPNIHPYEEYKVRLDSLKWLADRWHVEMLYVEEYNPAEFLKMFKSQHQSDTPPTSPFIKEGQRGIEEFERCRSCYTLRLEKTAKEAQRQGFDAFSTTLLISPYQNFEQIVTVGKELEDKYNVSFYLRDFRPYFRTSMAFAKELGLYRQKYCGCVYSIEKRRLNPKSQAPIIK